MTWFRRIAAALCGWPIFLFAGFWCFVGLTVVTLLALPFDRSLGARLGGRVWGRVVYSTIPWWTLTLEGFDDVGPGPYLIVSNHASVLDIPALMNLPLGFRVVAKRGLFHIPFLGWFMSLSGQIPWDKGMEGETRRRCLAELAVGRSVLMFPEGTRSTDGSVARFKRGAFQIAREAGVPVLVCAVDGTRHILGKGALVPHRFFVTVRAAVLQTQDPAAFDDDRGMARAAQVTVASQVATWQGRTLEDTP